MVTPEGNDARFRASSKGGMGVEEGVDPDRLERGRIREVQACEFALVEGAIPDRLDLGRDHERARDVGAPEGPVPDRHEREGGVPDRLDGRAQLQRAREIRVVPQEVGWDGRHRRVGELPARLRTTRSDGALLQPRDRDLDDGDAFGERLAPDGRDVEGRLNRGRDAGVAEGFGIDRHERGRIRHVQAREFGLEEGLLPDRLDGRAQLERARDVGLFEGVGTDRHERGCIREVQAREFGVCEGGIPDSLDVGWDHERARDAGVG
eukprot:scaffold59608_cov57-Phaeocystis_antarctica.AAC.4